MNVKRFFYVFFIILFIFELIFLLHINLCTVNRLNELIKHQNEINAKSYEADERQDKELHLLRQDVDINQNILTSKDYLQYAD